MTMTMHSHPISILATPLLYIHVCCIAILVPLDNNGIVAAYISYQIFIFLSFNLFFVLFFLFFINRYSTTLPIMAAVEAKTHNFTVGMTCGGCKSAVERILGKLDGITEFTADVDTKKVVVKGMYDQ
jgi:Heavy-metal-associated domain